MLFKKFLRPNCLLKIISDSWDLAKWQIHNGNLYELWITVLSIELVW